MTKRLQVLFEDEEFLAIQASAQKERVTVAEWVRQALRIARQRRSLGQQDKLRAISKAVQHQFPTANIDQMLTEISMGSDCD